MAFRYGGARHALDSGRARKRASRPPAHACLAAPAALAASADRGPGGPPGAWNWLVLAGSVLAWLALAGRAWRESVTLAPDLLVVRDVFRTRRIALADVTGVSFGRAGMVAVRTAGAALPGGGGLGTVSY